MSYIDRTNDVVKIATCDTLSCASPTIQSITGTTGAFWATSLTLTDDNYPVVSYFDNVELELRLITCANTNCSSAAINVIDTTDNVGKASSIQLSNDGFPIISYYDYTNTNLKLAICTDATCTAPTIRVIDSDGSVGLLNSLALTSADLPIIAYYDETNQRVKLYYDQVVTDTGKPDSVNKTAPTNAAIITTTSATLTWDAVLNTSDYEYCIATSAAECTSWTSTMTSGTPTSVTVTDLSYDTTYYWQVRTTNSAGITLGNKGTTWSFSVVQLPSAFAKSTPTNTQSLTAASTTLTWASSANASSYEYCIAASIAACTTWKSTGSTRSATITGLAHSSTYYWQVRARNSGGTTSADSDSYYRFTVTLPPVSFAKTAPANNATKQSTSVTLTWAASTYATSYEYCIALATATCTTWKSTGTARTATITGLAKNKAYYWQVRAKNAGGTTLSNSTFWKFTTAP